MGCSGHQSPGLFTHPSDKSMYHNKLSYWTDMAKLLEKGNDRAEMDTTASTRLTAIPTGKLDGIFLADVWGGYDVYKGSLAPALASGAQYP